MIALLKEEQIVEDTFISKISWTFLNLVFVFSIFNQYFILNYSSTLQSVCTITRGQVSLSESIQHEKQIFPQREGNCLKVSWHHFVSASCSEWRDLTHTVHCAASKSTRLKGLLGRVIMELQLTSSLSVEATQKRLTR